MEKSEYFAKGGKPAFGSYIGNASTIFLYFRPPCLLRPQNPTSDQTYHNFGGRKVSQMIANKRSPHHSHPTPSRGSTTPLLAIMSHYARTNARMKRKRGLRCRDGKGHSALI